MSKHSYLTVTDQFCGAGGSSIGAAAAGAQLYLALNHWKLAIETHNTNFPDAAHDCTDISACDPRRYPSTDILITSPECTNHSLAKGKKRKDQAQLELWNPTVYDPSEERSRATMWDVPRFAEFHDYNLIVVENVVDARHWRLFDAWLKAMADLDYLHEIVYFNSQFAWPTPQSRDRMYVVFWKRGNPAPDLRFTPPAFCGRCEKDVESVQSWKNPTKRWGRYRFQYTYRCPHCNSEVEPYFFCAANAIDWSLPAERIGDRARPLKEKTLARIRTGLERYKNQALLVGLYGPQGQRVSLGAAENPFATLTASRTWGAVIPPSSLLSPGTSEALAPMPFLLSLNHSTDRIRPLSSVMPTVMTYCTPSLVIPHATDEQGGLTPTVGNPGQSRTIPAFLLSYYTRLSGSKAAIAGLDEAVPTIPGWAVHYLASPGASPLVEDCGFRMLQPAEIQSAMAFPDTYVVLGNQRMQIRQLGNGVTPPVMQRLLERGIATLH